MNNQPQAQHPDVSQVPDHRLKEMEDRFKLLEADNQKLRGQIDYMARSQAQSEAPQQESPFTPEVETALNSKFQKLLEEKTSGYQQQIGLLYDANDKLAYQQKFGSEKYAKFDDKVDRIRQEQERNGRWVSREEALKIAWFETEGSKVQDPKLAEAPKPVWDPYYNQYVDPLTRKPVDPSALEPQEPLNSAAPVTPSAPPQAPQMPQAQVDSLRAGGVHVPQENIALPVQSTNSPAPLEYRVVPQGITEETSEADLDAWAEKNSERGF